MAKKKLKPRASMKHSSIQELANHLAGEMNLEFARRKLNHFSESFATESKKDGQESREHLILWISDYEITPEEKTKGHLGNFAKIAITPTKKGLFRLVMEKVARRVNAHPRRLIPERLHPNAGHPAIRNMQRRKVYRTIEEAREDLADLRRFPKTSLINPDTCKTVVYSKEYITPERNSPVLTWHLHIEECEGGFRINGHTGPFLDHDSNSSSSKSKARQSVMPLRIDDCFPSNHTLVDLIFGIEGIAVISSHSEQSSELQAD